MSNYNLTGGDTLETCRHKNNRNYTTGIAQT